MHPTWHNQSIYPLLRSSDSLAVDFGGRWSRWDYVCCVGNVRWKDA